MFIPSNAAIKQAVTDGVLPANTNPTLQSDKDLVSRFILYHILNKTTVVPDGKKSGVYSTLLSTSTGDAATFNVTNTLGSLKITDANGRVANLLPTGSNVLSNYIVIHQIDTYLKYKY